VPNKQGDDSGEVVEDRPIWRSIGKGEWRQRTAARKMSGGGREGTKSMRGSEIVGQEG